MALRECPPVAIGPSASGLRERRLAAFFFARALRIVRVDHGWLEF